MRSPPAGMDAARLQLLELARRLPRPFIDLGILQLREIQNARGRRHDQRAHASSARAARSPGRSSRPSIGRPEQRLRAQFLNQGGEIVGIGVGRGRCPAPGSTAGSRGARTRRRCAWARSARPAATRRDGCRRGHARTRPPAPCRTPRSGSPRRCDAASSREQALARPVFGVHRALGRVPARMPAACATVSMDWCSIAGSVRPAVCGVAITSGRAASRGVGIWSGARPTSMAQPARRPESSAASSAASSTRLPRDTLMR